MSTTKHKATTPWGVLLGLLAGCLATLSAVAAGVDPDEVLVRALQAALAVAAVWTAARLAFAAFLGTRR